MVEIYSYLCFNSYFKKLGYFQLEFDHLLSFLFLPLTL